MPLTKAHKAAEVAKVTKLLDNTTAIYVTDYMGLNVGQLNELRVKFHESGVQYRVVKNTLMRIALDSLGGYEALYDHLSGPTAVATCTDPSAAARVIRQFKVDTSLPLPMLKVAYVDGAVYAGDQIDVLASLKSREELIGDVVGLLLSSAANIVGAIRAPGATLAAILETLQEKASS